MFIIKKDFIDLKVDDILHNVVIDLDIHLINISYSGQNPFDDPIGFIQITNQHQYNGWSYFKEFVDFLNQEKLSALIWIGEKNKKNNILNNQTDNLPLHISSNLCCIYEGNFAFLSKTDKDTNIENWLISIHENPLDSITSCDTLFLLLDKIVDYKDSIVYMDNKGEFKNIKNYSNYTDRGIIYCNFNTYFKPASPIIINSNDPVATNHNYDYYSDQCFV